MTVHKGSFFDLIFIRYGYKIYSNIGMVELSETQPEKLFFNFITAREGAVLVGYSADYVARLAREGKIVGRREGKQWLVDRDSLKLFTLRAEAEKRERNAALREERRQEKIVESYLIALREQPETNRLGNVHVIEAVVVMACLGFFVMLGGAAASAQLSWQDVQSGFGDARGDVQQALLFDAWPDFSVVSWLFKFEERTIVEPVQVPATPAMPTSPTEPEPEHPVTLIFSDDTTVNVSDDRHGTITARFGPATERTYTIDLREVNPPTQ